MMILSLISSINAIFLYKTNAEIFCTTSEKLHPMPAIPCGESVHRLSLTFVGRREAEGPD
jgi:hypothetical protein